MSPTTKVDSWLFSEKNLYAFHVPITTERYRRIHADAATAGLHPKTGGPLPIFERGKNFGWGWIAVEVEKPERERTDVIHLEGEFQVYEHIGPYNRIGDAVQRILRDNPHAKDFYNVYMNNPASTAPEELRTQIWFR